MEHLYIHSRHSKKNKKYFLSDNQLKLLYTDKNLSLNYRYLISQWNSLYYSLENHIIDDIKFKNQKIILCNKLLQLKSVIDTFN